MRKPNGVTAAASATGVVVCSSFVLSYAALVTVGQAAGFSPRIAWLYPVSVDGLLAVGMVAAVMLRSARARTRAYVWLLIGAGIAASVVGNAAHAASHGGRLLLPTGFAWGAGAVPPLALAAALHLLIVVVRHSRRATSEPDGPELVTSVPFPVPPAPTTSPSGWTFSLPDTAKAPAPATSNGHARRTPAPGDTDWAALERAYLADHPGATRKQTAVALGTSTKTLQRTGPQPRGGDMTSNGSRP